MHQLYEIKLAFDNLELLQILGPHLSWNCATISLLCASLLNMTMGYLNLFRHASFIHVEVLYECWRFPHFNIITSTLYFFRVRFHYGHPDIFDRLFHLTRGGVSKASKIINLSEDIFAGRSKLCEV